MRPAFVLGIGSRGREVARRLKDKFKEGRPYLVYCALSTKEGEGAPLEPIIEDYFLSPAPRKTEMTSDELDQYGPLADSEPVKEILRGFLHAKDRLQALLSRKAEILFSQERWVGGPQRTGEGIALYLITDLADPLSLLTLDLLHLVQKASDYPVLPQAILLVLEESPYIYPVLQDVWKASQGSTPILSRGAFLIERNNEEGEKGTEEERLTATVEWLGLVIGDRLPYHDDIEKPHLGSFGIAQGVVPKEHLSRFFTLRLSGEFLKKWIEIEQGPSIEQESIVKDLVEKPVVEPVVEGVSPDYSTEVRGDLAPPFKFQHENASLYPEGRLPDLDNRIINRIRNKIDIQEERRHKAFRRSLQGRSKEILEQFKQGLNEQLEGFFGGHHPFAEGITFLNQQILLLKERRQEAKEQLEYLEELEERGVFQEESKRKPLSPLSFILGGYLLFGLA